MSLRLIESQSVRMELALGPPEPIRASEIEKTSILVSSLGDRGLSLRGE